MNVLPPETRKVGSMIVITGATGALNGGTVEHLLRSVPAAEIAVVARDTEKAWPFADRGIEVRYGDYEAPASLPGAFAGADQLLLVSSSDPAADAVALHRAAIDAAVTAGVVRVLYTSHQGAAADTPFGPGRDHAATEQLLAESGLAWTSLRNGFYMHSLQWLLGRWSETRVIAVPADGPVSWTSRSDAAEAAAAIILSDGAYDGPVTITASNAPTFEDIAALASEVTRGVVRFEVIDPDDWIHGQTAAGTPEFMAHFQLSMYQAAAHGYFAGTDPLLRTLIDHEPQTVRDYLAGA